MALLINVKNMSVDLTSGVETEEVPMSWTLKGFAKFDETTGQETLVLPTASETGSELPLVAVAPILLTGFGKWIEGKETPFKAALESLDGGELNITRRLDFPTGDTLTNMRKGILAKTIVSKSEKDGIELETGVSVGDISALEIQELFNVKKLHDYEESIHHEIKGGKHILTGHAFLVYENFEGQQIRAKMTSTWNFGTLDGDKASYKEKVHSVRRSMETHKDQLGDVVKVTGEGTTLYSS